MSRRVVLVRAEDERDALLERQRGRGGRSKVAKLQKKNSDIHRTHVRNFAFLYPKDLEEPFLMFAFMDCQVGGRVRAVSESLCFRFGGSRDWMLQIWPESTSM